MDIPTTTRGRGRPRRFDIDTAVTTSEALFHARGYDSVSVIDLTEALGIKAPSFYAAFGSKAALFERVLKHYAQCENIPLDAILSPERPLVEGLSAVLKAAAALYARNPHTPGCLVLESMRANDPEIRQMASGIGRSAVDAVRHYVSRTRPDLAERLSDYVAVTMAGLSSAACNGYDARRLDAVAGLAATGIGALVTAAP